MGALWQQHHTAIRRRGEWSLPEPVGDEAGQAGAPHSFGQALVLSVRVRPDPATSPDGRYVLVTDVESGEVGMPDGRGSLHERRYCGFIDTRSGCLLARQTGQFCGGQFNDAGAWASPALPDLHPSEVRPTAEDDASGRLSSSDAPDGSLDNLLRCDPPGPGNRNHYGKLIDTGIFDVTPSQRRALYGG